MKHGAEAHYISPYVTYVTSQRQPTVGGGFNPVADTQAIAARFVAPTGLAGPVSSIELMGRRTRRRLRLRGLGDVVAPGGVPFARTRAAWQGFWANFRAKMAARRGMSVIHVDASPRGPAPAATSLAVQSGWAPAPQSAATAAVATASYSPAQGDPPNRNAVVTAVTMDPAEAAFPQNFWSKVIYGGYPPVVAARAQEDVVSQWFANKAGS